MELLDERGRIFGIINIIDLLAVLFAVAVVVAGVALVFSGGSSEDPELGTRYVTLDLGNQPGYVTERIDAGDGFSVRSAPDNLTITDVYVTPTGGQSSSVTIRARVGGQLEERRNGESPRFIFDGDPLILSRQLTVETSEYQVSGTVTAVESDGESLDVSTTEVLLTTTMPQMGEVINALKEAGIRDQVKVIVGGAPVTEEYAQEIGADMYAANAASAFDRVKEAMQAA